MESVETVLTWMIVIGIVLMVAGGIVIAVAKRKKP